MNTKIAIPPEKAPQLVKHLNEVLNAIQDANNNLVSRLTALPYVSDEMLAIFKAWSAEQNHIHTSSDLFVIGLRGDVAETLQ